MESGSKTILLVEDEAIIALMEKTWLVKEGYRVIHVLRGEAAIEKVNGSQEAIDLILMDIDLGGGIDGAEAAREILKDHDIPLIFLSSHSESEIVSRTEQITSYGYVLKDSTNTVLLASIKMAFKLHKAHKDLKEAMVSIQSERQKAELYLNIVQVLLVALDSEGRITLINKKGCEVLGYSEDELIGKKWSEYFLLPDESEILTGHFKEAMRTGLQTIKYAENHIITKGGERHLIAWHNSLLKDKSGRTIGILGSGEDITEERKAEEALRESERNFRQVVETIGEGIAFVNPEDKFVFANPAGEEIFGVEPGGLAGKNLTEFQDDAELKRVRTDTSLIEKGNRVVFETVIRSKDNQEKTLLITATPRFSQSGKFLGKLGIFRDITRRKENEKKIRESEHRLSEIAKNIPGIVYQYCVREDWTTYFSYVSEKAFGLLGLTIDTENIEKELVKRIPEEDQERFNSSIIKAVTECSPWEYEGKVICNGGRAKWFQGRSLPERKGNELVFTGLFIDITELKETELLLKKYSEELKLSNTAKDKFFSILAHDLKGPFTGFMGLTEEMVSNLDSLTNDEVREYAAIMNSTAKKMYDLLSNLLEWTQLQTGKIKLDPKIINLFEETESILNLFSSATAGKAIKILNGIPRNIYLNADQHSLSTILRNLISNAVKFTPSGGVISISSNHGDRQIEVKVTDSGVGMDKEVMQKLFRIDSGFSTPGTNGEEGSGLGLVLCKELIEMNGWEIQVQSSHGEGSTVSFKVPLQQC